jgi:D-alanyl-lipoteichoic acid acyltransferase DltB (MBOAT superfamily)
MYLFVIGMFQKIVIADGLLASGVEAVFDSKAPPTFADGWLACMAFACQIFCDFAGYSICAIGVARCLGFWLPTNFNYPLASSSFADFWRRWHISLSTWLRDYVYRSLGGNRVAYARWVFNLLFTWTLIGLWHGASWRFVLWGFMSGSYMVIERTLQRLVPPSPLWSKTPVLLAFAIVQFAGFSISLLGFRGEMSRVASLGKVMLLGSPAGRPMILSDQAVGTTIVVVLVLFCWHWFMRKSSLEQLAERTPLWLRAAALAAMLFSIVLMPDRDRAFIYFRF